MRDGAARATAKKSQKTFKNPLTNRRKCGIINTESEVRNTEQNERKPPRAPSKADLEKALLARLDKWIKEGDTPEEAVGKLTQKQYDFLIDRDIDLDNLLLTPEQQKAVREVKKAHRTCSPNGYNKKYPEPKQALYRGLVAHLQGLGAEIHPKEKENFRDLDFTVDGTHYRIVLSNPRK